MFWPCTSEWPCKSEKSATLDQDNDGVQVGHPGRLDVAQGLADSGLSKMCQSIGQHHSALPSSLDLFQPPNFLQIIKMFFLCINSIITHKFRVIEKALFIFWHLRLLASPSKPFAWIISPRYLNLFTLFIFPCLVKRCSSVSLWFELLNCTKINL